MSKLTGEVGAPLRREPDQIELEAYLEKLRSRGLGADGRQLPDPTPLAPPLGWKPQPSMVQIVREMVRSERLRMEVEAAGAESFEDADDFEVGDEPDQAHSPFENDFDPPIKEMVAEGAAEVARRARRKAPQAGKPVPPTDGPADGSGAPSGSPAAPEEPVND